MKRYTVEMRHGRAVVLQYGAELLVLQKEPSGSVEPIQYAKAVLDEDVEQLARAILEAYASFKEGEK